MSIEARDWAYSQPLKAPLKPVLVALAEHVKDRPDCWPSMNRLADLTGYDRRTVRRAIKKLDEIGLISVEHRPGLSDKFTLKLSTTRVRESRGSESHSGQSAPGGEVRESWEAGQSAPRTVKNRKGTGREEERKVLELPEWMPKTLWGDFVEHRRKAKASMTDIAQQRVLKKLAAMRKEGQDIEAVVEQSIINGWTGLFPVKETRRNESRFSNSIEALNSIFGEEHGQDDISAGHGLSVSSLLEGDHERDGSSLLGPARRSAG